MEIVIMIMYMDTRECHNFYSTVVMRVIPP